MKQVTTYVGIDAHKKDLFVAMLIGAATTPVTWQLANEPGAVRRMVVSQGAKVVLVGTTVGIAAALASTRLLDALLYDVNAVDPVVFVAMSMTMIGIGMLASYVPARRASNVDPIESLRND